MTNNWTMPDWMRDVLETAWPNFMERAFIKDVLRDESMGGGSYRDEDCNLAETMAEKELLESLRAAGLLLTPGEREDASEALGRESMALADANRELTRLRAENERLRDKLERVADVLRYNANSRGGLAYEIERALEPSSHNGENNGDNDLGAEHE